VAGHVQTAATTRLTSSSVKNGWMGKDTSPAASAVARGREERTSKELSAQRRLVRDEARVVNRGQHAGGARVLHERGTPVRGHANREQVPYAGLGGRKGWQANLGVADAGEVGLGDLASPRRPGFKLGQKRMPQDRGMDLVEAAVQAQLVMQVALALPVVA
jgi:hypothetical protein